MSSRRKAKARKAKFEAVFLAVCWSILAVLVGIFAAMSFAHTLAI